MDLQFPLSIDSAGRLETIEGVPESAQRGVVVLQAQQGEWDFDLSFGIPWLDLMSRRPFDEGLARGVISEQLLAQPGIDTVDRVAFELNTNNRTATVDARATASGTTIQVTA
jgi:hypothetical protein